MAILAWSSIICRFHDVASLTNLGSNISNMSPRWRRSLTRICCHHVFRKMMIKCCFFPETWPKNVRLGTLFECDLLQASTVAWLCADFSTDPSPAEIRGPALIILMLVSQHIRSIEAIGVLGPPQTQESNPQWMSQLGMSAFSRFCKVFHVMLLRRFYTNKSGSGRDNDRKFWILSLSYYYEAVSRPLCYWVFAVLIILKKILFYGGTLCKILRYLKEEIHADCFSNKFKA